MLWHKAWIETRVRFIAGLCLLTLLAMGTVFGYPAIARRLLSIADLPRTDDALGRALQESLELARTFRGYAYSNGFSDNLAQLGTLFAVLFAVGALLPDATGTLFTLSLPVSRRRILTTRVLTGLAELLAVTLVPSLTIAILAPAIGEHFGVVAALVHALCLFVGTSVFFGLTFWLSTQFTDNWRPALIACAIAVGFALCEAALSEAIPYGPYWLIRGDSYFYDGRVPVVALLVAAAAATTLIYGALATVERRDF